MSRIIQQGIPPWSKIKSAIPTIKPTTPTIKTPTLKTPTLKTSTLKTPALKTPTLKPTSIIPSKSSIKNPIKITRAKNNFYALPTKTPTYTHKRGAKEYKDIIKNYTFSSKIDPKVQDEVVQTHVDADKFLKRIENDKNFKSIVDDIEAGRPNQSIPYTDKLPKMERYEALYNLYKVPGRVQLIFKANPVKPGQLDMQYIVNNMKYGFNPKRPTLSKVLDAFSNIKKSGGDSIRDAFANTGPKKTTYLAALGIGVPIGATALITSLLTTTGGDDEAGEENVEKFTLPPGQRLVTQDEFNDRLEFLIQFYNEGEITASEFSEIINDLSLDAEILNIEFSDSFKKEMADAKIKVFQEENENPNSDSRTIILYGVVAAIFIIIIFIIFLFVFIKVST